MVRRRSGVEVCACVCGWWGGCSGGGTGRRTIVSCVVQITESSRLHTQSGDFACPAAVEACGASGLGTKPGEHGGLAPPFAIFGGPLASARASWGRASAEPAQLHGACFAHYTHRSPAVAVPMDAPDANGPSDADAAPPSADARIADVTSLGTIDTVPTQLPASSCWQAVKQNLHLQTPRRL